MDTLLPSVSLLSISFMLCFMSGRGCFHGYGDGWLLYSHLGANRIFVVVPLAACAIVASYVFAGKLSAPMCGWLGERSRRRQLLLLAGALTIAAGGPRDANLCRTAYTTLTRVQQSNDFSKRARDPIGGCKSTPIYERSSMARCQLPKNCGQYVKRCASNIVSFRFVPALLISIIAAMIAGCSAIQTIGWMELISKASHRIPRGGRSVGWQLQPLLRCFSW